MNIKQLTAVILINLSLMATQGDGQTKNGLVGLLYDNVNLERIDSIWYLEGVDSNDIRWQTKNDFSAQWIGYIKAPANGTIYFSGEADDEIFVKIEGKPVIDTWEGKKKTDGSLEMIKGKAYDIEIRYNQINGPSYMKVYWWWKGQEKEIIPSASLVYTDKDEAKISHVFKKLTNIDLTGAYFDADKVIQIHKPEDVLVRRKAFIDFLWGKEGLPKTKFPSSVEKGITDADFDSLSNLKRIDKLTVDMDFGLKSIAYHFVPNRSNNQLTIYHQGHNGKFSVGIKTIQSFLDKEYEVIGLTMPLLGLNNKISYNFERFGTIFINTHGQMDYLQPKAGHPVKYFLEPVATAVNYAQKFHFDQINMIGISGGGWTTTLYAAIDPRISRSFPTSGSLPLYLRSMDITNPGTIGDYEQGVSGLYRAANYLELYILGSFGKGRGQVQILNEFDPCCFGGTGFKSYEDIVKGRVTSLGEGSFDVFLDSTHRQHQISPKALEIVFEDLENISEEN